MTTGRKTDLNAIAENKTVPTVKWYVHVGNEILRAGRVIKITLSDTLEVYRRDRVPLLRLYDKRILREYRNWQNLIRSKTKQVKGSGV